jgi:hypothetical protein
MLPACARRSCSPLASASAAIGCAAEEDWIVRPPGGGGGGGGGGDDAAGTDGGAGVSGRLCVIDCLRTPDACPVTDDAAGVTVRVRGGDDRARGRAVLDEPPARSRGRRRRRRRTPATDG